MIEEEGQFRGSNLQKSFLQEESEGSAKDEEVKITIKDMELFIITKIFPNPLRVVDLFSKEGNNPQKCLKNQKVRIILKNSDA